MAKKYSFDIEHLEYVEDRNSLAKFWKQCRWLLLSAFVLGVASWGLTYSGVVPSIKHIRLQNTAAALKADYNRFDSTLTKVESFLSAIQYRDDSCYRVVSQLEPLSENKRKASFGGVNRYEYLEGYFNSDLMIHYNYEFDVQLNRLKLQKQSYDVLLQRAEMYEDSLLSVPAIMPLSPRSYRISSTFGWRIHPISHDHIHHDGIDMATSEGHLVYASGKGVVESASKSNAGYGNQVVVNHGFGYKTRYAHLSKIMVRAGDTVTRGTIVGKVGSTGRSTGPHLHYEVVQSGSRRNPSDYMVSDQDATEYREMIDMFRAE